MAQGRLAGKRCLVTGGSGGLGAATCLAMAREGAKGVAVHYSGSKARAEDVAAQARKLGADAFAVQADVASRASCDAMVKACTDRWGGLDAVVAYAGHPWREAEWSGDFMALPDEAFEGPFRIDLLGSVHVAQAALPALRASGKGSLVLTASSPALTGDVEGITYLLAKAGIVGLAKSLARVHGKDGVRVNAIAPGSIATEAMAGLTRAEEARLAEETALKRLGKPEDVAAVAVFLCSDEAAFLTGAVVPVDGGLSFG